MCLLLMTGPVAMDSPSRGILKNGGGRGEGGSNGDDSYLFCNVPEHHDLVSFVPCNTIFKQLYEHESSDFLYLYEKNIACKFTHVPVVALIYVDIVHIFRLLYCIQLLRLSYDTKLLQIPL